MDKQVTYQLKLSGEGLDLERDVSPEVAHSIVRLVFGGVIEQGVAPAQQVLPSPQLPLAPAGGPTGPALSIREFLETHNAKRIPEQIASIALFLKTHHNTAVFTRKDLIRNFEDAQEPVPKNLPRDIAWATKIGWIAPKTGTKKTYYLTGTGENAVNAKFPEEVKKKTKVSLKPRKKHKATPATKS